MPLSWISVWQGSMRVSLEQLRQVVPATLLHVHEWSVSGPNAPAAPSEVQRITQSVRRVPLRPAGSTRFVPVKEEAWLKRCLQS